MRHFKLCRNIGFAIAIFLLTLSAFGCATKFVPPSFNTTLIPNPPNYPNGQLSNNAIRLPEITRNKGWNIVFFAPNAIGFIERNRSFSKLESFDKDAAVYYLDLRKKKLNRVYDQNIKDRIISAFKNTYIVWLETTSGINRVLDAMLTFTTQGIIHTFEGTVSNLDGSIKKNISLDFDQRKEPYHQKYTFDNGVVFKWEGRGPYGGPTKGVPIKSLLNSTFSTYLSPDGRYLIIGQWSEISQPGGILDTQTGKILVKGHPIHTHPLSKPPVLRRYRFSPGLDKIALFYTVENDNSLYVETVDFKFPLAE